MWALRNDIALFFSRSQLGLPRQSQGPGTQDGSPEHKLRVLDDQKGVVVGNFGGSAAL